MASTKNPKRNTKTAKVREQEEAAQAFITGANRAKAEEDGATMDLRTGVPAANRETSKRPATHRATSSVNKTPIMIRIDPALLERVDRAAARLGISRSAFIVSSTAERVEQME